LLLADLMEVGTVDRNFPFQRTLRVVIAGLGLSYLGAGILMTLGIKHVSHFQGSILMIYIILLL